MRFPIRIVAAGLVLVVVLAEMQSGRQSPAPASTPHRDAIILLGFQRGIQAVQAAAIVSRVGGIDLKSIGDETHVVYVGQAREKVAIDALKRFREVRYAEPDFIHRLDAGALPNDTYAGNQWAISNTGQTVNGVAGTSGADERSSLAWRVTTGTNTTVVAVLDTGVQYTHPDLATNMWNNPGGIGGCPAGTHGYNILAGNCDPMDDDGVYGGHGTHVAGILGAAGNNHAGVAGVNWTSSIMAMKWVNSSNTGYTSDLISAMDWVIQAKQSGVNVRVVNDSATWPGTASSQALSDAIDLLGSNDILFVSAAGNTAQNNDTTPRYPCSYDRPTMICAAATDQNDQLSSSSNYGVTTVKLGAPGVNIYSTLRQSNYGYISGGSMAAPQVSGTAALILSQGYQSVSNLRLTILKNVDPLTSLQGLVATGGRLNVCNAVPGCSVGTVSTPANMTPPVISGVVQLGSLLGASTGTWSGLPTTYTYQWYRCGGACTSVNGATSPSYSPMASSDIGLTLAVAVTASNAAGSAVTFSALSSPIASAASPFTITSTIQDGDTISGKVNWQVTPSVSANFVQFFIEGTLVQTVSSAPFIYNGSTTGYLDTTTLNNGQHVLGVRALSADNRAYGFHGGTVTVQNPPQNLSPPVISGSAIQGQTLSTTNGTWTNSPTTFFYQWNRCDSNGANCSPISGATTSFYTLTAGDVGFTARSAVTAMNGGGSSTASSVQTSTVTGPGGTSGGGGPGGAGGIALVQSNAARGSAVGSLSVSFPAGNQAGNLIIAAVRMSTTWQSVTVTDSSGNLYVDAVNQAQSTDGHQLHLFYAKNVSAGPNTVTATFSSTNNHPWLAIYEYSGLSPTNPLDLTAHAPGSGSMADSGATSLTSSANELIFAATGMPASYAGTVAPGAGYTLQQQDTGSSRGATEAAIVNSTGSFDGVFNLNPSANWTAVVATFKPASSSGGGGSGGSPVPPITLLQSNAARGSGVGSLSVSFPAANQAGNLIIAVVRMSTTWQTVSIADSAGNSYAEAVNQVQTSDGHQLHLFYAKNIAGAANTVTCTFSSTNNHPWLAIFEYNGMNTTNPLDQTAHAQGSGASADTGATAITGSANELVFAAAGLPASYTGAVTAGMGYTLQQQDMGSSRSATEWMTTAATGSFDGVFSLSPSTNWSAVVATFRP